jgi:anti-anti-sigma factor
MDIFKREVFRQKTVITLKIHTLDASNARSVSRRVAEAMKGVRQMVLDLGSLRYFDLAGFAVILQWASGEGPEVRFCSQSGAVQALFELLGGNAMVPLFFSREEAMASFQGSVSHPARTIGELTPEFEEHHLDARRAV